MLINTEQYKNPNLTPADRKARVEANLKRLITPKATVF